MNIQNYLTRAEELRDQLIADRRVLHSYAETGFDLPKTTAYVEARLRELGLTPVRCGRAGTAQERRTAPPWPPVTQRAAATAR